MKIKLFFLSIFLFCTINISYTQTYPVTLRVVDKTFGMKSSNERSIDERNIVAVLSAELKFQCVGTDKRFYPMYKESGTTGEIIKNDTAWTWKAVIQAPIGSHSWIPSMKSSGYNPLNKSAVYYGENDELVFSVDATGNVTGITEIIIQDTQYPVTLKIIDKSKGEKTNSVLFNDANVYLEGGKPTTPSFVRTDLHRDFVLHQSKPELSDNGFDFNSGVNIGVWLSQTSNRGSTTAQNYFKKNDLKNLADMGFDHIRLPVDEKEIFDTNGDFIPSTRQLVHDAIAWCGEYNLRIILDFHILRSHYFNDAANDIILWKSQQEQDKMVEMWEKLSQEYGSYPNSLLAYELLNEANAPNADVWNQLSARIIAKIREREPDRMLVIGGISHNSAGALATLTVPENDKNITLVFHFYSPHLLTHYQASWMDGLKDLVIPLHYPGQLVKKEDADKLKEARHINAVNLYNGFYNKAILKDKIQTAITRANQLGLKLYCSEYGCIGNTNKEIKYRWMRDVAEIFRENNIAYSVWGWKENFGILNSNGTVRDQRVIDEIAGGAGTKYDMFTKQGNVLEKNNTAWIWSATVLARTGCYTWRPGIYSEMKPINETVFQYDKNQNGTGFLQFNVALNGVVSGVSELIISSEDTSIPELNTSKPQVYPTFFDEYIIVKDAKKTIELYTVSGSRIFETQNVSSEVRINSKDIQQGLYILLIDKKHSYKLIK